MGLLNLLKKANTTIEKENKKAKQVDTKNNTCDALMDELICNIKDNYNKEQVVPLFLKSMSYKPHVIGKSNDDYPRYMQYDYNILNVPNFHKELVDEGYFTTATFENVISTFKVDELKNMLLECDVDIKGLKKDALIVPYIKPPFEMVEQKEQ